MAKKKNNQKKNGAVNAVNRTPSKAAVDRDPKTMDQEDESTSGPIAKAVVNIAGDVKEGTQEKTTSIQEAEDVLGKIEKGTDEINEASQEIESEKEVEPKDVTDKTGPIANEQSYTPPVEVVTDTTEISEACKSQEVKPKKRLTLQERLAQAAKSKKSSKKTPSSTQPKSSTPEPAQETKAAPLSPQLNSDSVSTSQLSPQTTNAPSSSATTSRDASLEIPPSTDRNQLFPSNYKDLGTEELFALINEAQNKYLSLQSKNTSLTQEKSSLQAKIKTISPSVGSSSISSTINDNLLKEKDEKIAQLLREGEELAKKELRYSNTIKKLKSNESDYLYDIQELNKRLSSLEAEKRTLKETTKLLESSEKQLSIECKTLQRQLESEKQALHEEIGKNDQLSMKFDELNSSKLEEKNALTKEINELKRNLEKEKQKFLSYKQDHLNEAARLESKIEELRYQAENVQTSSGTIDEGYSKLIRQHETLQNQYTSATENWQSIEATLMQKINDYQSQVDELKASLKKSEERSNVLSADLESKIREIESLQKEMKTLEVEFSKLDNKYSSLSREYKNLEESSESQIIKFNQERTSLEFKVKSLEKQLKDPVLPQTLMVPDTNASNSSFNSPSLQRNNSSTPSFRQKWDYGKDIGFGESSTTPLASRKASSVFPPMMGYSENTSLEDLSDDGLRDDDDETINSPVLNSNSGQRFDNNSSSYIGGTSVQMLGKMSSQVRRLQIELSSMKDEVDKLTKDKGEANEEIVRLMKDNEQVDNYKAQIDELKKRVESLQTRHERTLEILGEKSEQVEELKADVLDLKDICRQQVQQLVDLHH